MAEDIHLGIFTLADRLFVNYVKLLVAYAWEWLHWLGDRSPSTPGLKIITGSTRLMPVMEKKVSDKHWDSQIARKPFRTPNDVLVHLKQCEYRVGHLHDRPKPCFSGARAGSREMMSAYRHDNCNLMESKVPKGKQLRRFSCCLFVLCTDSTGFVMTCRRTMLR